MKLLYYPETDSLYIELSARDSVETREVTDDILVDFDSDGNAIGIDFQHAARTLDLETLEAVALPLERSQSA